MQENHLEIILIGVVVLWVTVLISFLGFVLFIYQKRQYKILKQLEDETLGHISRELHDNVGQLMTVAKLNMISVASEISEPHLRKVVYAIELLSQAMDDVRNISKSLSLELIRTEGLPMAIDSHLQYFRKVCQYEITFRVVGIYKYLDEQKEIFLFRILQEALNNIMRHAEAKRIDIELNSSSAGITLHIIDDGKGFDMEELMGKKSDGKHLGGIRNMKARATQIKSQFILESYPGKGTSIKLSISP